MPNIDGVRDDKELTKVRKLDTKSALQRRLEEDVLMASQVGDAAWLQQCLETAKLSLDVTDNDGLSPVHLAALECQLDCLKILVEMMNVDVNLQSQDGWTPLHLAINNTLPRKSVACVTYLLSLGADASSVTSFGITPMHQASACGNVSCLQFLIEANGRIDGVDDRGHTPLSLATLWGYRECSRILRHFQWQKDRKFEEKIKRQILREEEEVVRIAEEQKKKEKAEKRLKGQKAYQLWLSKNQFSEMPTLFGHETLETDEDGTSRSRRGASRQNNHSPKASKSKKSSTLRPGQSSGTTKGTNKKVEFIPINGPGSPTPGKRLVADFDKRTQNLSLGRTKAVQKRGPLQFPVI